MTPTEQQPSARAWWLEPREPLVFGDGSRMPALVPRHRFLLPPQGTLAGMVRTRFVAGQGRVSKAEARELLAIRLRGPWLAHRREEGQAPELWLPVPADVVATPGEGGERYLAGELSLAQDGEGTLWPVEGAKPPALATLADRLEDGTKTRRPRFPFWPFDQVVRWSLEPGSFAPSPPPDPAPITPEYRVHVAIDDATWTAEPEMLFSSAGLRYATGFGLAVEVTDGRKAPRQAGPAPGGLDRLLVLGAESRTAASTVLTGSVFPAFSDPALPEAEAGADEEWPAGRADTWEDLYRRRIESLVQAGRRVGLRLQLLTPGAFGGWQPAWPPELEGKLLAVCMDRFVPVSGWDLQARGPRRVRRLVPAGSVYYLGPFGEGEDAVETPLRLCRQWWGASLCQGQGGDEAAFLAPPAHDGYGLVLPAPFPIPRRSP